MPTLQEIAHEILEDLEIDQVGLAKLAGVSKSAVSQWFSGHTKRMAPEPAFALQRKVGWSAEYLMTGHGPKKIAEVKEREIEYAIQSRVNAGELLDMRALTNSNQKVVQKTVIALSESLIEKNHTA